jgi:hypothetical protein
MSQTVFQNQAEDLVAYLVDSLGAPVTGLTPGVVAVQYFKDSGSTFIGKSLADTGASITSGNNEPFALLDGQYISISVNGAVSQTVEFDAGDFANIGQATAAEIVSVINAGTTDLTATVSSGAVVLTTDLTGETRTIQITGGAANGVLDFTVEETFGTTPWKEIGAGVYTVEFDAGNLDTIGVFVFKITGVAIVPHVAIVNIVENPADPESAGSTQTCVLTGTVLSLAGEPIPNAAVVARILGFPTISDNLAVLTDDPISTLTDSNGNFELEITRGVFVDISIPLASYRRSIDVPNLATANLFLLA